MKNSKRAILGILCAGLLFPLGAQTTGTLSFTCTTYAPSDTWGDEHIVAVWIQNNQNPSIFIKTNAKYGYDDDHLTSWEAISSSNLVDAVTGATPSSYGTISVTWDGTDVSQNVVADGDYSLYIEMGWGGDKVNDHAVTAFTFTKDATTNEYTPAGNTNFSSVSLTWQPATTLISDVEDKNGISIFPNPSYGAIKLNFQQELRNARLDVSDLSGKIVYSEKPHLITVGTKTLNLTDLPSGMYVLTIYSEEKYFSYKLLIEE